MGTAVTARTTTLTAVAPLQIPPEKTYTFKTWPPKLVFLPHLIYQVGSVGQHKCLFVFVFVLFTRSEHQFALVNAQPVVCEIS